MLRETDPAPDAEDADEEYDDRDERKDVRQACRPEN